MSVFNFISPILIFFTVFSTCPFVLSQSSPNQTAIMENLSVLLKNTTLEWDMKTQPNPCLWKGVNCTGSVITNLTLSGVGLSSSDFLPLVCQIDSLQAFDVSHNQLSSIPGEFITSCGKLDGLKVLNFSMNRLVGSLPTFVGFVGLESLDLSVNQLEGNIGRELDGLVSLKTLNLNVNHFAGTIPEQILRYRNLTQIDLSVNNFDGPIPDRIGELSMLENLILSSNHLTGRIPESLTTTTTLSRFAANQNSFSGPIPAQLTKYLSKLDLSYNRLTGPIPVDFFAHPNLQTIDLTGNLLEGSIPDKLSSTLVRLRLGNNSLSEQIPPTICATPGVLTYLELDNNNFRGGIPDQLSSCQNLTLLNLAQNNLNGPLPEGLGNLRHLQVLKLQVNKLSGEIPDQLMQLQALSVLNMSWNYLTGSISASISNLHELTNLNLQHNQLRGQIPMSIRDLNSLMELQLGENQLNGTIPIMPIKLQIGLNLSSNLFDGPIPKTLERLSNLEVLDLSNNKFSGEIPDFLTQMASLTQVILSNNNLGGDIPDFPPFVSVDTKGNLNLRNKTTTDVSPGRKKVKSVAVPIVIALGISLVVIGAVTVIILFISRRYYKVNDEQEYTGRDHPSPQVIHGKFLTSNAIHKSNICFQKAMEALADSLNCELKTKFSTYYKAVMPSGVSYFIKELNRSDKIFQLGSFERFEQELEVLGKLHNSNVMTPLAYVLSTDRAYLFYEYALKGTLHDALHGSPDHALDWPSRYSIAVGVAQGLAFLHGYTSSPIILFDLSSKNILLKSSKEPRIGDIELCKVIDPSKSTGNLSTVAGSVGYIPPEYAYTMRVTMAGNIYSFGVILLELLTGKPAVSEGTELAKSVSQFATQQDAKLYRILDFSISRTSIPIRSQMLAVLKIAIACVNVSPETRPKSKSLLHMLVNAR